jgi:ribosomal protein S11
VLASFNNTIVSITDQKGAVIALVVRRQVQLPRFA